MRRLFLIALCCLSFQIGTAAPAQAWWEFIEAFSGPGNFWGWDIEGRLVCLPRPTALAQYARAQSIERAAIQAEQQFAELRKSDSTSYASFQALTTAVESWDLANQAYKQTFDSLRLLSERIPDATLVTAADAAEAKAKGIRERLPSVALPSRTDSQGVPSEVVNEFQAAQTTLKNSSNAWKVVVSQLQPTEETKQWMFSASPPALGVFFSACPNQSAAQRRASVDVGFHYLKAPGADAFAGGKDVVLMMFIPSFSWRMLSVLDGGTGAGAYWFTSEGFTSFRGVVLEPFRFDVHAPPAPPTAGFLRALASVPLLRVGMFWFPAGFEDNAFAQTNRTRIAGEPLWRAGLYSDLSSIQEFLCRKSGKFC